MLDNISCKTCHYGIIGDCNANSHGSRFFAELSVFCEEFGLIISDVRLLGGSGNVHTFVSAAHGSTSWIDHCLSSPPLHDTVQSILVIYDVSVTDHMPIVTQLRVQPTTIAAPEQAAPVGPAKLIWRVANSQQVSA